MDSRESLTYITSRAGKEAIVQLHVEGIIEYLEANLKSEMSTYNRSKWLFPSCKTHLVRGVNKFGSSVCTDEPIMIEGRTPQTPCGASLHSPVRLTENP